MSQDNKLTSEEAFRGAQLVLANGAALLEDAKVLHAAGRYPRAIALAILAMEEFGKIPRLLNVDRYQRDGRMKAWWRYFRSHEVKSGLNALTFFGATSNEEDFSDLPENWHEIIGSSYDGLKLRALYVDFVDGAFVSPEDLEDAPHMAEMTISLADASLKLHQSNLANLNAETHAAKRPQMMEFADALMSDPSLVEAYLEGRSEDEPAVKLLRHTISSMKKRRSRRAAS